MINPSRLVQELNNTGLQNKDTPLYQLLLNLIRLTLSITNSINAGATNINPSAIETIIIQQAMQGIDGLNGEDGMSIIGPKGDTGSTGSIGLTGAIGARGFDGIDGEDGLSIPGPKGDIGLTGATGATGASGASSGSVSSDSDGYDNDLMSYPNPIGPFKSGSVLFYKGKIAEDDKLFWDDVNNYLGIGTNAPNQLIYMIGSGANTETVVDASVANLVALRYIGTGAGGLATESIGDMYINSDSDNNATGKNIVFGTDGQGGAATPIVTIKDDGTVVFTAPIKLKGYTVATLPAGIIGYIAYCTDLLAPAFLAVAVGGGTVVGVVFYNGANWVAV